MMTMTANKLRQENNVQCCVCVPVCVFLALNNYKQKMYQTFIDCR